MLGAMSNVPQHQYQSLETDAEIAYNLKEMFSDQGRRQQAMRALMSTKMSE